MRPPDALFSPTFQAPPRRRRCAVLAWEILPPAARDENVEDGFDRTTVVRARSSGTCWWRQEGADEVPLPVRETNSAQASRLIHPATVLEPALVYADTKDL